jgi:hypothetical protein
MGDPIKKPDVPPRLRAKHLPISREHVVRYVKVAVPAADRARLLEMLAEMMQAS